MNFRVLMIVASCLLAACQTTGLKDSSGVSLGAGKCVAGDPVQTKVDWRVFGSSPKSVAFCRFSNRNLQQVEFVQDGSHALINWESLFAGLIDITDPQGLVSVAATNKGLDAPPTVADVRQTLGKMGDILHSNTSENGKPCVYFMTLPEVGEKVAGGGSGVRQVVHGRHCDGRGHAYSLEKIQQLEMSSGPFPVPERTRSARHGPNPSADIRT